MSWKEALYQLEVREAEDLDTLADAATRAKDQDVGFVNPASGAGILGRENGTLEGFADYGLGFRFNPEQQSLMIFAPNLHIFSQRIEKHDTVAKDVYLKEEYEDIHRLLTGEKGEAL